MTPTVWTNYFLVNIAIILIDSITLMVSIINLLFQFSCENTQYFQAKYSQQQTSLHMKSRKYFTSFPLKQEWSVKFSKKTRMFYYK